VATTTSVLWRKLTPVFVDIEPDNFCIDPTKIEAAITPKTRAIMAVHVFGYACDVDAIDKIAKKHNLKVIYDAAHAFGCRYRGKSLPSYGDVSTLSLHATKVFHTIEGGAIIVADDEVNKRVDLQKRFGFEGEDYIMPGTNAKADEFRAAMGLVNFPHLEPNIAERRALTGLYDSLLNGILARPKPQDGLTHNYIYHPVVFKSEADLLKVFAALNTADVYPRRYFYPSLNLLPYVEPQPCPVSEDISPRIAALPLWNGLPPADVERIAGIIKSALGA